MVRVLAYLANYFAQALPSPSCLPANISAPTMVPTPNRQTATAMKWINLYLARRMNHDKAISTGIPKQSRSCHTQKERELHHKKKGSGLFSPR